MKWIATNPGDQQHPRIRSRLVERAQQLDPIARFNSTMGLFECVSTAHGDQESDSQRSAFQIGTLRHSDINCIVVGIMGER